MNRSPRPSPSGRDRAVATIQDVTAGVAVVSVVAVGGFGVLAAISYAGTTATTTTTSNVVRGDGSTTDGSGLDGSNPYGATTGGSNPYGSDDDGGAAPGIVLPMPTYPPITSGGASVSRAFGSGHVSSGGSR